MQPIHHTQRKGFSLLEMAAASALVAGTLVPALAVVRDSMATSRELHRRNLLANYAVRILEDQAALVASLNLTDWNNAILAYPIGGDFSTTDGHPDIRYTVTISDDPIDGGIDDQLMHVEVVVYDDADADDSLDAGELQQTLRTKVAKLNSYENEEQ